MSGLFYKTKQKLEEVLTKADKTQMMGPDLVQAYKLSELMRNTFYETKKRLREMIVAISEDGKSYKNQECQLSETLMFESTKYPTGSLLNSILETVGRVENGLSMELTTYDIALDENFRKILLRIINESFPEIEMHKAKLSKLRFNLDTARSKLKKALSVAQKAAGTKDAPSTDKITAIQEEVESALSAFETQQDLFATEVFNFIAQEKVYADMYIFMLEASREYHKNCFEVLEKEIPGIKKISESSIHQPVFGLSLNKYKDIFGQDLSFVIEECCEYLNLHGIDQEGLFRVSGSQYKVKKMISEFNAGLSDLRSEDPGPQSVATCLKNYLRELPEPILTYELEPEFIEAVKLNPPTKLSVITDLVHRLPQINYANLEYLMDLLHHVVLRSEINKMTAKNIGIVMGPNLLWSKDEEKQMQVSNVASAVCEVLVIDFDHIFGKSENRVTQKKKETED